MERNDPDDGPDPPTTGLVLLVGAAACVGCLATLAAASAAVLGASLVPPALLGTTPETILPPAVPLAVLGGYASYALHRERRRRTRGDPPDPYWTLAPRRTALSLILGAVAVAAVALAAKLLVESLTDLTYTIHWLRTVALLAVAWVIQGELNRRAFEGR